MDTFDGKQASKASILNGVVHYVNYESSPREPFQTDNRIILKIDVNLPKSAGSKSTHIHDDQILN